MELEISPEPSEEERTAILAALANEPSSAPPGPWIDPLGDDQEP